MEKEAMTIPLERNSVTENVLVREEIIVTLASAVWSRKQCSLAVRDNLILGDYVGDTFRQ